MKTSNEGGGYGTTAARFEYYPFGGDLVSVFNPTSGSNPARNNPFRFSTKYRDNESKCYYYGYRYLRPKHGRWISRDPLGETTSLDLYRFVTNTPINTPDYLGLFDWIDRRRQGDRSIPVDSGRGAGRDQVRCDARSRARALGGDFSSDWAGRQILSWYLWGGGLDRNVINDAYWTGYVEHNSNLTSQTRAELETAFGQLCANPDPSASIRIDRRIQGRFTNGEAITGYNYLNGSNSTVGGYHIWGTATKRKCDIIVNGVKQCCCCVDFDMNYQFSDIVDANPQYTTDSIKNTIAEVISLGHAERYTIRIFWKSKSTRTNCLGQCNSGWPYD